MKTLQGRCCDPQKNSTITQSGVKGIKLFQKKIRTGRKSRLITSTPVLSLRLFYRCRKDGKSMITNI